MSAFMRPALNRPVFICLPNNIKGNVGARGGAGGSGRVGERGLGTDFLWSDLEPLPGAERLCDPNT